MNRGFVGALCLSVTFALLAGCDGSEPPIGAPGTMSQSPAIAQHAARGKSWTLPGAKNITALVYASDVGSVNVYDYKTGVQVGSLDGFNNPYGQCVDKHGDVFLTTSIGSVGAILEYEHGGSSPIQTLNTDGHPIGCSINPVNGDLAANNGLPGGGSDVQIWKGASGNPTSYANQTDCGEMWPPGYDDKGNLYIEAGSNTVCELPAGSTNIIKVPFDHEIGFPGGVVWDGKYLTFGDQESGNGYTTAIYQVKRRGNSLHLVGITKLKDDRCGYTSFIPFIVGAKNTPANHKQGTVVLGGNQGCDYKGTPIRYWQYPRGGQPFNHVRPKPYGTSSLSVSIAP
jgi:hypothetical protein